MGNEYKKPLLEIAPQTYNFFTADKVYPKLEFNSSNNSNIEEDHCIGLETDLESITILIAKHFFNTRFNRTISVRNIVCGRLSSANLKTCELTLSDGVKTSVFYNPDRNVARVQLRSNDGTLQHCRYSYTCSTDGSINLVELDCGGGID